MFKSYIIFIISTTICVVLCESAVPDEESPEEGYCKENPATINCDFVPLKTSKLVLNVTCLDCKCLITLNDATFPLETWHVAPNSLHIKIPPRKKSEHGYIKCLANDKRDIKGINVYYTTKEYTRAVMDTGQESYIPYERTVRTKVKEKAAEPSYDDVLFGFTVFVVICMAGGLSFLAIKMKNKMLIEPQSKNLKAMTLKGNHSESREIVENEHIYESIICTGIAKNFGPHSESTNGYEVAYNVLKNAPYIASRKWPQENSSLQNYKLYDNPFYERSGTEKHNYYS